MKSNNPSKIAYKKIKARNLKINDIILWPHCGCKAKMLDDQVSAADLEERFYRRTLKLKSCLEHSSYSSILDPLIKSLSPPIQMIRFKLNQIVLVLVG